MDEILFYAFGALAISSALLSVTRKNAVAAACWLVVMFFGLAGVFVLLEAYFVAAIQILVYAGAIMVLFLFVIMLLDMRREELLAHGGPRLKIAGVVLSVLFLVVVGKVLISARDGEGVAERVSATLVLPAPPAGPAAHLTSVPEAPKAPPPRAIAVAEAKIADVPMDEATAAWFAKEHARPRIGSLEFPGLDGAMKAKSLLVGIAAGRGLRAWVDEDADGRFGTGEELRTPQHDPVAGLLEERYVSAVPGAAPGTSLEISAVFQGLAAAPGGGPDGSPFAIGKSLFDEWILPFEITSILLLGAIFGAVVLTKKRLA